jgi:hypothetical protein
VPWSMLILRVHTLFILPKPLLHSTVLIDKHAKDSSTCLTIGILKFSICVLKRNSVRRKQARAKSYSPHCGGVVHCQVDGSNICILAGVCYEQLVLVIEQRVL